ncbi:hypothetical protein GYMLUDRAFT_65508 [Collybiopsis luxurians FD-317 M1]|uniref:Uncharacterized protein n=1 Tax=Collybiopsis luxurians FD-317 M1 TaxID=944289 RepID=A0A0D0BK67_9AGAR|nr:hypothetical protein GYMLUDRAFT_65508 [Collybiopsis luxurians FD-317 M1]
MSSWCSDQWDSAIRALEVLRNFLSSSTLHIPEVELQLREISSDWRSLPGIADIFNSIIELEPDDDDRFGHISQNIESQVGALSLKLYTTDSPLLLPSLSALPSDTSVPDPSLEPISLDNAISSPFLSDISGPSNTVPSNPHPPVSSPTVSKQRLSFTAWNARRKVQKSDKEQLDIDDQVPSVLPLTAPASALDVPSPAQPVLAITSSLSTAPSLPAASKRSDSLARREFHI